MLTIAERNQPPQSPELHAFTRSVRALGGQVTGQYAHRAGYLINQLKLASLWGRIPALYLLASPNSAAARVNLMAPGTWTLTEVASPTFTANRGYAGNGTTSYVHMGVGFASVTGISVNNSGLFVWSLTDDNATNWREAGGNLTTNDTYLVGRSTGGVLSARGNAATGSNVTSPDSLGFYGFSRRGASIMDIFKNGQVVSSPNTTSTIFATGSVSFCRGGPLFSPHQLAIGCVTKGLTATEMQNLYTALQFYLIQVGAVLPAVEYFTATLEGTPRSYVRRISSGVTIRSSSASARMTYIISNGDSNDVGARGLGLGAIVLDASCPAAGAYTSVAFPHNAGSPLDRGTGARGWGVVAEPVGALADFAVVGEFVYPNSSAGQTHLTDVLTYRAFYNDTYGSGATVTAGRVSGAAGLGLPDIGAGTQVYTNLLAEVKAGNTEAKVYGYGGGTHVIGAIHQDGYHPRLNGDSRATYTTNLNGYSSSVNTDVKSASTGNGQSESVPLWICQCPAPATSGAQTMGDTVLAEVDVARSNALVRLIGPRHQFLFASDNHMDTLRGHCWIGELIGKASILEEAGTPLYGLGIWVTYTLVSTTLTIQYWKNSAKTVPWNNLVMDTTWLPDPGNNGFTWYDDNNRTITGVSIVNGAGTLSAVQITLNGAPSASNRYLGYAYDGPGNAARVAVGKDGPGAWGNLRDSDTTYPSRRFAGEYVYNWAIGVKDPVP